MANYISKDGLNYFWGKLKDKLAQKVDKYIAYKQYTNDYFYNSTSNGNCTGYDREFAQVIANDWSKPWFVKFIIKTDMFYNGTTHYPSFHEVLIGCDNVSGTTWVRNYNIIKNTSYRSSHYISVYRPQSADKATVAPFRFCFRAGDQSSKTANLRTYDVYLVEAVNCTCTLNEELDNQAYQKWYFDDHSKNAYYWSATSGGTFYSTNFNICDNGLQETGDADSYACYIYHNYFRGYVSNKLRHYSLFAETVDGKYESLTTSSADSTSQDKVASTTKFRLGKIYYFADSTTRSADYLLASSVYLQYYAIDFRYTANITTTGLTSYAPVYIVGNYDSSTDSFTVDSSIWTHTLPTEEDGKIYILVGYAYTNYSGNKDYRVTLRMHNTVYYYKGGSIKVFNPPNEHTHSQYLTSVDISGKLDASQVTDNALSYPPSNQLSHTAVPNGYAVLTKLADYVPAIRTINSKALSSNITLTAEDVDAYSKTEANNLLDSKANLSGATFTGQIQSTNSDVSFKHTNGSNAVGFGVGSGKVNRGVYDYTNSQWMIYCSSDKYPLLSQSPATADNSNKVATTSFVKAQGYLTSVPSNYLTTTSNVKEAYLSWGGKNFSGSYGCIDAAMVGELGANRLAFGKADGIIIEYSRDNGATWSDYEASDSVKKKLFAQGGAGLVIGKSTKDNRANENCLLRVTIDTNVFSIYTVLNKFVIYLSTSGSTGSWCTIDASFEATPETFTVFADKIPVSGWSGYNVINTNGITTYGNTPATQYGLVRFTFGCTSHTNTSNAGLQISKIMGFGGVGWSTPSTMASNGHLYSFDEDKNATFPANVTATQFNGATTKLQTYKAGSTTETYGTSYLVFAQWKDSSNVALKCTNYTVWTDSATNATTATKLGTSNVGNSAHPIYLKAGVPTASVDYSVPSTNATSRYLLLRPADADGDGASHHSYSTKISYVASTDTLTVANLNGNATTATTATKLGTASVGSTTQAIYLNAGTPTAITNSTFANTLITSLPTWTADPTDNTYFVRQDTGGSDQYGRVKASTFYNYIKGKLDSVYQPKGTYLTSHQDISGKLDASQVRDDALNLPIGNQLTHSVVPNGYAVLTKLTEYVPTTTTINNKALSSNITLTASDVGASASGHTHSYAGSSSAGGPANDFVASAAADNVARYVYFAYNSTDYNSASSTKGRAVYDADFKYNPSTNVLTVGSITGKSASADALNLVTSTTDLDKARPLLYPYYSQWNAHQTGSYNGQVAHHSNLMFTPQSGRVSLGEVEIKKKIVLQYNETTESLDFVFA